MTQTIKLKTHTQQTNTIIVTILQKHFKKRCLINILFLFTQYGFHCLNIQRFQNFEVKLITTSSQYSKPLVVIVLSTIWVIQKVTTDGGKVASTWFIPPVTVDPIPDVLRNMLITSPVESLRTSAYVFTIAVTFEIIYGIILVMDRREIFSNSTKRLFGLVNNSQPNGTECVVYCTFELTFKTRSDRSDVRQPKVNWTFFRAKRSWIGISF